MTLRVLHVTAELAGFVRGPVGDVVAGLAEAQAARGHDVTIVLPRSRAIAEQGLDATLARRLTKIAVPLGQGTHEIEVWEGTFRRCRLWLVDHPALHQGDARSWGLFCKAALAVADEHGVWPDVVHAHDWQAGLALLYARTPPSHRTHPRRIFSLHDLAAQGIYPPSVIDELDLPRSGFHPDGYEYWGNVSFLKAGLVCAEAITTPSPRHAKDIRTHGHGFEGLLRALAPRTTGIVNGIDDVTWAPSRDPHLARTYDLDTIGERRRNKEALQHELKLPLRADLPLVGVLGPYSEGVLGKALPELVREGVQVVACGALDAALAELEHRDRVRVVDGDGVRHRVLAGSDLVIVPSPGDSVQRLAQLYGAPPIVHATGVLADTVVDFDGKSRSGTGFTFDELTEAALIAAVRRAIIVWRDDKAFTALRRRAMAQDFSWRVPAAQYERVYRG